MEPKTLTKEMLIEIIEEVMQEYACHRPSDGRWTKCKKGTIYSVLDTNDRVSDRFKGRGTVSKKKADGTYSLASRFGENGKDPKKASGRKTFSGEDIPPKHYVGKRYPRKYASEALSEQWSALQQWLSKQNSNKDTIIEEDECSGKYREGHRLGQNDVLAFLAKYHQAIEKKGK